MPFLRIDGFPASAASPTPIGHDGLPAGGIAVSAGNPMVLGDIHRSGVHLAVWHRDLPDSLTTAMLRPLMAAAPFTLTAIGTPDELTDQIVGRAPAPIPGPLLVDIADLAWLFAVLDDHRDRVRIRLEALTHDGCTKWHADQVGLRLLCTYQGAGTQWLCMGGGASAAQSMTKPPLTRATHRLPTGAIAILKGERYPDNGGNGCIHRSPPAGPGRRARLLLCIDQPTWNLQE